MKNIIQRLILLAVSLVSLMPDKVQAQDHPRIFVSDSEHTFFLQRLKNEKSVSRYIEHTQDRLAPYLEQHRVDPEWIVSRLQMYWQTKYKQVFVKGMDFSHGDGAAPVPTVRFSGSRDWATDYLQPALEDVKPYMDDSRGIYLQNKAKNGQPWEWVHPAETGHIIEKINYQILQLAQDAAFLYWIYGDKKYAQFAQDIFIPYMLGMHHRDPPQTVEPHRNADLMGLQTFEVIHESVVRPLTLCYDFLYSFLDENGEDLDMMQSVFKKWAEQEIKYGVPGNNWNLMQAGFITYLALALEKDEIYADNRGQQYYLDQILHHNTRKQKSLRDVMKNFDAETGIWPEVAGYSIMVSDDLLEIFAMMDKSLNNYLLNEYPILEKAILANFNYLFPNGFTTAYGDAKHSRLKFNALELMVAQYRKYGDHEKEELVSALLRKFIQDSVYQRDSRESLFDIFFHVAKLNDGPAKDITEIVHPTFYSDNVSWIVQRNGASPSDGMMVSTNASLGNHSHANGINIELFAKGMVVVPDAAAGVSYWSTDHKEYYSRFPAHNTVIVDGKSNYGTMNSSIAFKVSSIYPDPKVTSLSGNVTYANVDFIDPATNARQQRLTSTVRTDESHGYFVDIFRSARVDKQDLKHEFILHGQGAPIQLFDRNHNKVVSNPTDQLGSQHGDLEGYDYFYEKREITWDQDFIAQYQMPSLDRGEVGMKVWMKGFPGRTLFTALAPPSRALHRESVPADLLGHPSPTLLVRQMGEAHSRPFVSIIEVQAEDRQDRIIAVDYFSPSESDDNFLGIEVAHESGRTDYIYNNSDENAQSLFSNGIFRGNYGVITTSNKSITSLLLGNGHELGKNGYAVRSKEKVGSIEVLFEEDKIRVLTAVDCTLLMPLEFSEGAEAFTITRGAQGVQSIKPTMVEIEGWNGLQFDLPAGKVELEW